MPSGTWSGRVLVFDIPAKGPHIVLSEELDGHQTPVTDIASEPAEGQVTGPPPPPAPPAVKKATSQPRTWFLASEA